MCCRYQSDVHVPGVQAQVQCTGALVHRCTGTVYQQVILQVQCELCSVQGINTMYSVQCNVHTSNWRGIWCRYNCRCSVYCTMCRAPLCTLPTGYPTRDTVQCAVCSVQYELYTNMYSLNCTIICTQYAHNVQWTNSHTLGNLVSHSSIKAINKGKLCFPGFIKA